MPLTVMHRLKYKLQQVVPGRMLLPSPDGKWRKTDNGQPCKPAHQCKIFSLSITGLLVLVFSGISFASELSLAVASVPASLPVFVAESQGFFAAEGIKPTLKECFPGRRCLAMLLDGQVTLATAADTPIVLASFTHTDFVVLATLATLAEDSRVIGSRASGVLQARDLIGKRIGVIKGTSGDYYLSTFLLYNGIVPEQVTQVDLGSRDAVAAFQRHEVDAISVFQPLVFRITVAAGSNAVLLRSPHIYTSKFNLVAARSLLGKNETDMQKVLRALLRAQQYIAQQPKAAQAILQNRLKLDPIFVASIWPQLDFSMALEQTLIKTLEAEARWLAGQPGVEGKRPENYLDLIHSAPLSQVRPNAITLVK